MNLHFLIQKEATEVLLFILWTPLDYSLIACEGTIKMKPASWICIDT